MAAKVQAKEEPKAQAAAAPAKAAAAAPAAAAAGAAKKKVALVTGANKGIGYAIVDKMAKDHADYIVLLGSRDQKRGEESVKKLGRANVQLLVVDIDDEKSVQKAAEQVKKEFGGLDVLCNNAGMAWKGDAFDENVAITTFRTNYYGTLAMLTHFLPIMRDDGRVSNVSSMAGASALRRMSQANRTAFLDEKLTVAGLSALMDKFRADVKANTYQQNGWPKSCYGVSKAGMSMLTRIFARDNKRPDLLINCCCPGYVVTDMTSNDADLTPAEGAEQPLMLCFLPKGSPSGVYFKDLKQQAWF